MMCYVVACCAIQRACDSCSSVYKVNSITYCCPNCTGSVLVTALICTCTVPIDDPRNTPKCTISNKVIGDYYYGLTSWKTAANMSKVSTPLVLIGLSLVQLMKYWSRHCGWMRRILYSASLYKDITTDVWKLMRCRSHLLVYATSQKCLDFLASSNIVVHPLILVLFRHLT